jgi:hypothetical protein
MQARSNKTADLKNSTSALIWPSAPLPPRFIYVVTPLQPPRKFQKGYCIAHMSAFLSPMIAHFPQMFSHRPYARFPLSCLRHPFSTLYITPSLIHRPRPDLPNTSSVAYDDSVVHYVLDTLIYRMASNFTDNRQPAYRCLSSRNVPASPS